MVMNDMNIINVMAERKLFDMNNIIMVKTFILSTFQKRAKGDTLMQLVCKHLNLVERDFFGLQYLTDAPDNMVGLRWIGLSSRKVKLR